MIEKIMSAPGSVSIFPASNALATHKIHFRTKDFYKIYTCLSFALVEWSSFIYAEVMPSWTPLWGKNDMASSFPSLRMSLLVCIVSKLTLLIPGLLLWRTHYFETKILFYHNRSKFFTTVSIWVSLTPLSISGDIYNYNHRDQFGTKNRLNSCALIYHITLSK